MYLRIRTYFDDEPNTRDKEKQRLVFFLQLNSRTYNAYTDEQFSIKLKTNEDTYKKFLRKFNATNLSYQCRTDELYFQTKEEAYRVADFLVEKYGIRLGTAAEKYKDTEQYFIFKDRNTGISY